MDEKKLNSADAVTELSDTELDKVDGGFADRARNVDGQWYLYMGSSKKDEDRRYVCPKCGRPLHHGTAWRYYCDPCDEGWFFESGLAPNLNGGVWKPISQKEYSDYVGRCTDVWPLEPSF